MTFISKQNIPFFPNTKNKQTVIGTSKFLLPYFYLKKYFNIFSVNVNKWTIEDNINLIHHIGILNEPIVRLITTPKHLINKYNNLRVTSIELCVLFNKYNYKIYRFKKDTQYFGNIYFLIKTNTKIYINKTNLELINRNTKSIIYL